VNKPTAVFDDQMLEQLARKQYLHADAGIQLDPVRTALVKIDMQAEFVLEEGGPFRVPAAFQRIPQMARLLGFFRERRWPVVHTAFAATHRFLDRPRMGGCMPSRAGDTGFENARAFCEARFVEELQPLENEIVILKPSYGAFYDTPLETILRRMEIETVVLAGTLTDCCVGTTARQAYERGFGAVVAEDATATCLEEMHNAELAILRRSLARVLSCSTIMAELEKGQCS